MATTLELVLLYLVAAVAGVVLCRLAKLPPMLGYLAVGVVIGPNALALAKDSAGVEYLGEFGVVPEARTLRMDAPIRSVRAGRRA